MYAECILVSSASALFLTIVNAFFPTKFDFLPLGGNEAIQTLGLICLGVVVAMIASLSLTLQEQEGTEDSGVTRNAPLVAPYRFESLDN